MGLDACLIFDNCHFFNEDSSEWLRYVKPESDASTSLHISALSGLVAKEQEEFTMARLNVILAVPLARTKQQASVKVKKSDKWNAQMELSGGKDMFQSE